MGKLLSKLKLEGEITNIHKGNQHIILNCHLNNLAISLHGRLRLMGAQQKHCEDCGEEA